MGAENFVPRDHTVTIIELDSTLRDGGQALPDEHQFKSGSKPEIAAAIARQGIHTIEAGFPATKGDGEEVAEVARTVGQTEYTITPRRIADDELVSGDPHTFTPVITGLTMARPEDVETTWEAVRHARKPGIHVFLATDERNMRSKHPTMTRQQTLEMFQEAVRHARDIGGPDMTLEISCELASTTDPNWLNAVYRTMLSDEEAKINVLNLPDTTGRADDQDIHDMFYRAAGWVYKMGRTDDVTLSTHNHNDRGRAVQNSIAAIRGVLDSNNSGDKRYSRPIPRIQVEVESGAGLGERAGNTNHALFALDLLLWAADGKLPVKLDYIVDTVPTKEVAEFIMAAADLPVPLRAPVVGPWITEVFSGAHSDAAAKAQAADIYSAFNPEWFGHDAPMNIGDGKYQGRRGKASLGAVKGYKSEMVIITDEIAEKAKRLNFELSDEEALERVVIAHNTRAVELGRRLADTEIEAFLAEETGLQLENHVVSWEFSASEDRGQAKAEIFAQITGQEKAISHSAESKKGAVDAVKIAINEGLGFDGDIDDVVVFAKEGGSSESSAGAIVDIAWRGDILTAYGEGATELEANVDAYINGYTMICRLIAGRPPFEWPPPRQWFTG